MGPRHRKFYIAENLGYCRLYNFKNGDLLAKVIEPDDQTKDTSRTKARATKDEVKKESQILELIYVEEQNIVISVFGDSTIKVYESKPKSELELLKEAKGAHPRAVITVARYAQEVCMLYTGASDGSVACWSLEASRLVGYFQDDKTEIISLADLFPYPAILVGNSKGMVTCWKTTDIKKKYPLLFKVSIYDSASATPVRPITAMLRISLAKLPLKSLNSEYVRESLAASYDLKAAKRPIDADSQPASLEDTSSVYRKAESMTKRSAMVTVLLLGTGFGSLQIFSVDAFMEHAGVEPLSLEKIIANRNEKNARIALLRKESINGENYGKLLEEINMLRPATKTQVFLDDQVYLRAWRAHKDSLVSLNTVSSHTDSFLTCGEDKFFRIWTFSGKMLCQINIVNSELSRWNFQYDWAKLILNELDETFKTIEQLDRITIGYKQREALQVRYLYTNFLLPEIRKTFPPEAADVKLLLPVASATAQKVQFLSRFGE